MILLGKLLRFIADNLESILAILSLIFTLAVISAYVSLIVIGIKGIVIDIKDYKRLKPQFKELEKSLEEETDTTELLPLQKGKPIFESFVSKFDDCEGTAFDKSNATFKAMNLFNKMKKLRDNVQKNVLDMQEMKYDVSPSFIPVYNTQLRLLNCYNTLMSYQPETLDDIDKIEWIFNKGALRTEEEITEMKHTVSAMKFRNEEYLGWKLDAVALGAIPNDVAFRISCLLCSIFGIVTSIEVMSEGGFEFGFSLGFNEGMLGLGFTMFFAFAIFLLSIYPIFIIAGIISIPFSKEEYYQDIVARKADCSPPLVSTKKALIAKIALGIFAGFKRNTKKK